MAHPLRKFVLSVLENVPECRQVLKGDRRRAISDLISDDLPADNLVLSADLSKASDCI